MDDLDTIAARLAGEWRHLKTGGIYTVSCVGRIEATLEFAVVYAGESGVWIRPYAEFIDGRFVKVIRVSDLTPAMKALFARDIAIVWDVEKGGYIASWTDGGDVTLDRAKAQKVPIAVLAEFLGTPGQPESNFHLERP
jgi:hypothetical protein